MSDPNPQPTLQDLLDATYASVRTLQHVAPRRTSRRDLARLADEIFTSLVAAMRRHDEQVHARLVEQSGPQSADPVDYWPGRIADDPHIHVRDPLAGHLTPLSLCGHPLGAITTEDLGLPPAPLCPSCAVRFTLRLLAAPSQPTRPRPSGPPQE